MKDNSSGQRSSDQEDRSHSQKRIQEYHKEIQGVKTAKSSYPGGVENFILSLVKDNTFLKKEVERLKTELSSLRLCENREISSKEEVKKFR